MSARYVLFFLSCLALWLTACSDEKASGDEAGVADKGVDVKITPDLPLPDIQQPKPDLSASTCEAAKLGKLCTKDTECGKNGLCLMVKGTTKICTCKCTPDDIKTPINEDTCPNNGTKAGNFICGKTNAPGIQAGTFCLKVCEPKLDANQCPKGVSCSTMSEYYANVVNIAVCLVAGCATDIECPVSAGQKCSLLLQDCKTTGATCLPLSLATLLEGRCFVGGKCDTVSGLCRPNKGVAGVKVGSPCKGDLDCGPNQECRFEMDQQKDLGMKPTGAACVGATECCSGACTGGKCAKGSCTVMFRNGYCTIRNCKYGKSLTHAKCPAGSDCNTAFIGGMCQKTCSLTNKTDCRGHAADRFGDYECRAWNKLQTAAGNITTQPVCDFGFTLGCDKFGEQKVTCEAVGNTGNTTKMACRSLQNKILASKDPTGYCLDDSTSGPVPAPSPDAGTKTPDSGKPTPDGGVAADGTTAQ